MERLLKGEFISIGELLRMKRLAPTSSTRQVARVGPLSVSIDPSGAEAAAVGPPRTVSQPLDYIEAFTSSLLPAQLQVLTAAATAATGDGELAQQLERMRQYVVFLAHAVCYFRKYARLGSYGHIVGFLEQQRQGWHDGRHDLATPDPGAFMAMVSSASAASPFTSGAALHAQQLAAQPASSSSSSAAAAGVTRSGAKKLQEVCKLHNNGNCRYGDECKYAHVCLTCRSPGHRFMNCALTPPAKPAQGL